MGQKQAFGRVRVVLDPSEMRSEMSRISNASSACHVAVCDPGPIKAKVACSCQAGNAGIVVQDRGRSGL